MIGERNAVKPLLKWAGGKRRLIPEIVRRLPCKWKRYYEPFAGGAALLCSLYSGDRIGEAVISDLNSELINFYTVIRDFPEEFFSSLNEIQFGNNREDFLRCRSRFNEIVSRESDRVERSVLFMYLNRHSYNGLWRVNSKGQYNVPFGRYRLISYPGESMIMHFSTMLEKLRIMNADYRIVAGNAGEGDFVYFDPPYEPESPTSSFTEYNTGGFGREDQVTLARTCKDLDRKKVRFMVSNSDTSVIADLYGEFNQYRISSIRSINSVGSRRRGNHELIITNYKPEMSKIQDQSGLE